MTQQPLLTDPRIWNTWRLLRRDRSASIPRHETLLYVLAECLRLRSEEQSAFSSALTSTTQPLQTFRSRWLSLWNECQQWHQNRPPEMRQVFSCRALEAGVIDPSSAALFPIEIFSSPLSLVENVIYHISSILLLASKPRLVDSQVTFKLASSKAWHMHSIAGICERNDFAEQWDPVLISGVLLIAPEMTHAAQQQVLLQCLRRARSATGLDLTGEINSLKDAWDF